MTFASAHASSPEFAMRYYRQQRALCQAVTCAITARLASAMNKYSEYAERDRREYQSFARST